MEEIIIPEQYKGVLYNYDNDIAIINLKTSIILSPFALPVCLYKGNRFLLDQMIDTVS